MIYRYVCLFRDFNISQIINKKHLGFYTSERLVKHKYNKVH